MTKIFYAVFTMLFIVSPSMANDNQRKIFELNNTIMNFTLASSKINDVLKYLNKPSVEINKDGHDLKEICFRNKHDTIRLIFITGVLHDYKTLYGFRLSKSKLDNNKNCEFSDKINSNITTKSGLSLTASKTDVLNKLGKIHEQENNQLVWKYEYLDTFETPIHRKWRAGPTGNKYTQHQTIKGEYHTGYISGKFNSNKLVSLEVIDYTEADFEIRNEYDSKSPFVGASLKCFGGPYVFIVSYDLSGELENYTIIKKDGGLFHQRKVSDLTSFSILWPDKDSTSNNSVSFSGSWDKNSFSGSAKSTSGHFKFNGEKFNSFCTWDR